METITILLVDDEPDFLEIMSAVIRGWSYNVITASGGAEAIGIMKVKKPDIVILDYIMPDMDGIAVLKEMRKTDKNTPVIMFTAHPNMKVIKGTEKLSISAFIPKLSTYSDVSSSLRSTIEMIIKSLHKKE
ncbi:MAG: response regulator [Candidatus Omnitrophota bacterium]